MHSNVLNTRSIFIIRLNLLWCDIFVVKKVFDSTVGLAISSGAAARVVTATCISPLELCRTKLQSQKMSYSELIQAVREMVAARGVGSLYLGKQGLVSFGCSKMRIETSKEHHKIIED